MERLKFTLVTFGDLKINDFIFNPNNSRFIFKVVDIKCRKIYLVKFYHNKKPVVASNFIVPVNIDKFYLSDTLFLLKVWRFKNEEC